MPRDRTDAVRARQRATMDDIDTRIEAVGAHAVKLSEENARLTADISELHAVLANERGEGEPPVRGFVFVGHSGESSAWIREKGRVGIYVVREVVREVTNEHRVRWGWAVIEDRYGTDASPRFQTHASGFETYARGAMRIAYGRRKERKSA